MPKQLKELVSHVLPKPDSWKLVLLQEWNTIVGDLKIQVRLERIVADTLILSVSNSSWMQELYCLSDVLIKKINKALNFPYIKKLRFKCSAPPAKKIAIHKKVQTEIYDYGFIMSPLQKIALSKIQDEQLQEAIKKFLVRCHKTNL